MQRGCISMLFSVRIGGWCWVRVLIWRMRIPVRNIILREAKVLNWIKKYIRRIRELWILCFFFHRFLKQQKRFISLMTMKVMSRIHSIYLWRRKMPKPHFSIKSPATGWEWMTIMNGLLAYMILLLSWTIVSISTKPSVRKAKVCCWLWKMTGVIKWSWNLPRKRMVCAG